MSKAIVTTCRIESVRPHANADRLEIAVVSGWQCVVPKGMYSAGSAVTYFPPDCVVPVELSDRLGVTKYLSNGRVRSARLRGEVSHGFVSEPMGPEGENVADRLGVTKWVAPISLAVGEAEDQHPLFYRYTDIENMRHYPTVLVDGESVVVTEKIHGTNSRIGLVREPDGQYRRVCGSNTVQRKIVEGGTYSFPWGVPGVAEMLAFMSASGAGSVILYGEVFGKVQVLRYGLPNGLGYRVFDASVDGRYLDYFAMAESCRRFGVSLVPLVYSGPFSIATVADLSRGMSLVDGADNIREGVVVRPAVERTDPSIGRVVLKYVSDDYLCGNDEDRGE